MAREMTEPRFNPGDRVIWYEPTGEYRDKVLTIADRSRDIMARQYIYSFVELDSTDRYNIAVEWQLRMA